MSDPRILILGGTGFIGRHLVKYIVDNGLASKVRVVDKVMPALAYLTPEFEAAFANPIVEFKQANLGNPAHLSRAFDDPTGNYQIVVDLAAETKYGQTDEIYRSLVLDVAVSVGTEAARRGCEKFVYVSTAQVYEESKKPSKESAKIKPWTLLAKYHHEAEEALKGIAGLPLVILRPATVYGPGDVYGLSPRLICAAVYKRLGKKMKFLWKDSLRYNTVHVVDVAAAIVHVAFNAPPGSAYNLSDKNETNQGKIAELLQKLFGIRTGFYGAIMSNLARMNFEALTEEANEQHMTPWSQLEKEHHLNTPLSPYLDRELLYNNQLSVDGSAIEETGFGYSYPEMTEELVREQINYWVSINAFPPMH